MTKGFHANQVSGNLSFLCKSDGNSLQTHSNVIVDLDYTIFPSQGFLIRTLHTNVERANQKPLTREDVERANQKPLTREDGLHRCGELK